MSQDSQLKKVLSDNRKHLEFVPRPLFTPAVWFKFRTNISISRNQTSQRSRAFNKYSPIQTHSSTCTVQTSNS